MPIIKPSAINRVYQNSHKINTVHNFKGINNSLKSDVANFAKVKPETKEKLITKYKRISISNHSGFAELSMEGLEACKTYDKFLISLLKSGCKFDEYPINVISNYWGGAGWNINFEKLGKNMQRYNLLKNSNHFKKNPSEMERIIFKQYTPDEENYMFEAIKDKKIPRKALIDICDCGYLEDAIQFYKKHHKQVNYKDLIRLSNQPKPIYDYSKRLLIENKNITNLSAKNTLQDFNTIGESSVQITLKNGLKENHYLKVNYDVPNNIELTRKETLYNELGKTTIITENNQGEIINETIIKAGNTPYSFSSLITKTKDRTQSWVQSEIPGNYNIYEHDTNGKKYLIGLAEINKETGARHIEKDLTSFDGTKTHYFYSDKPNGNKFLYYEIKDKDGKTLMKETSKTKFIDDNHCISTRNDKSYDIQYTNNGMTVTKIKDGKLTDEKEVFTFDNDFDKEFKTVTKEISGNELFNLRKAGIKSLIFEKGGNNAHCIDKYISIGESYINDLYVLEHELGHAKDRYISGGRTGLGLNPELVKIFKEEQNLLFDNTTRAQSSYIDYLVAKKTPKESYGGSLREALSDAQASVETPVFSEELATRSVLAQQFLPKTIAKTISLLKEKGIL